MHSIRRDLNRFFGNEKPTTTQMAALTRLCHFIALGGTETVKGRLRLIFPEYDFELTDGATKLTSTMKPAIMGYEVAIPLSEGCVAYGQITVQGRDFQSAFVEVLSMPYVKFVRTDLTDPGSLDKQVLAWVNDNREWVRRRLNNTFKRIS